MDHFLYLHFLKSKMHGRFELEAMVHVVNVYVVVGARRMIFKRWRTNILS